MKLSKSINYCFTISAFFMGISLSIQCMEQSVPSIKTILNQLKDAQDKKNREEIDNCLQIINKIPAFRLNYVDFLERLCTTPESLIETYEFKDDDYLNSLDNININEDDRSEIALLLEHTRQERALSHQWATVTLFCLKATVKIIFLSLMVKLDNNYPISNASFKSINDIDILYFFACLGGYALISWI